MRDVWVATLVSVAVLSAAATRAAPAMPRPRPRQAVVVAAVVALVTAATAWHRDLSAAGLERTVAATFPVQAAATVEARGYDGPLYNYYDWGGYLIWRLPRLPVAMDGRTNLHGDRRIERSILTWAGGPGWATDPELAAASVVIAPTWTALASLLRLDDRFRVAHEDDLAVVFIAAPAR
jgi:hypothetical protein